MILTIFRSIDMKDNKFYIIDQEGNKKPITRVDRIEFKNENDLSEYIPVTAKATVQVDKDDLAEFMYDIQEIVQGGSKKA